MSTVSYRDLVAGLRSLEINPLRPVIVHASLSAFGKVVGGAPTLLGALLSQFQSVMMPVFTYKTMLIPEQGPDENGITYGTGRHLNIMAEFFRPEMPADRLMGILPETLRQHPKARRSMHPILSFAGVNTEKALAAQSLDEPLAPVRSLCEVDGWALLLGVDHTVNTSIHYGEKLAGRRQFIRWALTPAGVLKCPGFPGCSDGFQALAPFLKGISRRTTIGATAVEAIPLSSLVEATRQALAADPLALLCSRDYCERCASIRSQPFQSS